MEVKIKKESCIFGTSELLDPLWHINHLPALSWRPGSCSTFSQSFSWTLVKIWIFPLLVFSKVGSHSYQEFSCSGQSMNICGVDVITAGANWQQHLCVVWSSQSWKRGWSQVGKHALRRRPTGCGVLSTSPVIAKFPYLEGPFSLALSNCSFVKAHLSPSFFHALLFSAPLKSCATLLLSSC